MWIVRLALRRPYTFVIEPAIDIYGAVDDAIWAGSLEK